MSMSSMEIDTNRLVINDPSSSGYSWFSCRGFLERAKSSRIGALIFYDPNTKSVSVDEVDLLVNTIVLVNALILTIPFGILTSLTAESMDEFYGLLSQCMEAQYKSKAGTVIYISSLNDLDSFLQLQYNWMTKSLLVSIYVPLISIILSVFYYFFRPSKDEGEQKDDMNKKFSIWFVRGRFLVLKILIGLVVSIYFFLVLANTFYTNFVSFSYNYCETFPGRYRDYIVASVIVVLIAVLTIFVYI